MTKYTQADFYIDINISAKNGHVVRWNSNDQVPFDDMLTEFLIAGYITQQNVIDSMNARKVEQDLFLEQYVANRQKYGYSDEEKFEMRAAFGDEEVVDIFTGKVIEYV